MPKEIGAIDAQFAADIKQAFAARSKSLLPLRRDNLIAMVLAVFFRPDQLRAFGLVEPTSGDTAEEACEKTTAH